MVWQLPFGFALVFIFCLPSLGELSSIGILEDTRDQNARNAIVHIKPGSSPSIGGTLRLEDYKGRVKITGILHGLTPGLHGFHIHEKGELGNLCKDALGHFNPLGHPHAAPTAIQRHVGDLGNIFADDFGVAVVDITDHVISLDPSKLEYVGGLAVVVHAGEDNLGIPGDLESLKTGRAGSRSGCGLIELQNEKLEETPDVIYAEVQIAAGASDINGSLELVQEGPLVTIFGTVVGLTPGYHGFHVHEKGDLGNQCKNAGGHFNPFQVTHGAPNDVVRHVGDLGNIWADESGVAFVNISDGMISLEENKEEFIGGLAIVIHAGEDNLGLPGDEESLKTGRAGARAGCGLIQLQNKRKTKLLDPPIDTLPQLPIDKRTAEVILVPGAATNATGYITLEQIDIDTVLITGNVSGFTPGFHGFHVHENGQLSNLCKDAGGHFNPFGTTHGSRDAVLRHVGDLGNIFVDAFGDAIIYVTDTVISLDPISKAYIGDRAVVIHAGEDNLGLPGDDESLKTGRAGARAACGLIRMKTFRSSQLDAAHVNIVPGSNPHIEGTLLVTPINEFENESGVQITGQITGLTPGFHGFHVHQTGNLGNQCKDAGGHFNPFGQNHGSPDSTERHVGDLGNILADENGIVQVNLTDPLASMDPESEAYIGQLAIVVHSGEDNFGIPGDTESLKTGRAGSRDGCGLITILDNEKTNINFDLSALKRGNRSFSPSLLASLVPGVNAAVKGVIILSEHENGVRVRGEIFGLSPGKHGFHIHQTGKVTNKCLDAGGHFDPSSASHGAPFHSVRHVGDLGNIIANERGRASFDFVDPIISLDSQSASYVGGRTFVVHEEEDNFGIPGDEESLRTGRAGPRAACGLISKPDFRVDVIGGSNSLAYGSLDLWQLENEVFIKGNVYGLSDGYHGFHIHEKGDLGNKCKNAGGHFNPYQVSHGSRTSSERHVGDLGNIESIGGVASIEILDARISLAKNSLAYIGERAIVIHAGEDNLGQPGDAESLKTGRAGARSACGLIKEDVEIPQVAIAVIRPGAIPDVKGVVLLRGSSSEVTIIGKITGLTEGLHGFHIHENGNLGNQCKNAGGHFNPHGKTHGSPSNSNRHVGDLGNVKADAAGVSLLSITDEIISLDPSSENFIGGKAFVVHDSSDNLGLPGDPESLKTGRAGPRAGCGIIQLPLFESKMIAGSNTNAHGLMFLFQFGSGVLIKGVMYGLSDGLHGFHVHGIGDLGNGCKNAGGHFNPHNVQHGAPTDPERHVGDLGNIESIGGIAMVEIFDRLISLKEDSREYIGNLAFVVHEGPDDLGKGGDEGSKLTGNAGARASCGLIRKTLYNYSVRQEDVPFSVIHFPEEIIFFPGERNV